MSDNLDLRQPNFQKVSVTTPISPRTSTNKGVDFLSSRSQSSMPYVYIFYFVYQQEFSESTKNEQIIESNRNIESPSKIWIFSN